MLIISNKPRLMGPDLDLCFYSSNPFTGISESAADPSMKRNWTKQFVCAVCLACLAERGARAFLQPWARVSAGRRWAAIQLNRVNEGILHVGSRYDRVHTVMAVSSQSPILDGPMMKPRPFKSRRLGSFEKMLTQTRDGKGPAEEGVRTLMNPHAWVAVVKGDLPKDDVKRGVMAVLSRHPMLRACIRTPEGPKVPVKNLIGEVRADGDPLFFCETECNSLSELADMVLAPETNAEDGDFERAWQERLEFNLDNARFPVSHGPNWRLEVIRDAAGGRVALVCTMNHALEDQRSSNIMLNDMLAAATGSGEEFFEDGQVEFPPSMEEALVEGETFRVGTAGYLWSQATSALSGPQVLPDNMPPVGELEAGGYGVDDRRSLCEYATMTEAEVTATLKACRERGVSMSAALSAACLMACSDVAHRGGDRGWHRYKFLMAVDLRRFGAREGLGGDWTGGTVACAGGAMDYVVNVQANSGKALTGAAGGVEGGGVAGEGKAGAEAEAEELFWRLARRCKRATKDLVEGEIAREAVAVFDWAMESMDIWASLNIESRNAKTLGRAYTVGVSNMGRYPFSTEVGGLDLEAVHFATRHATCGSLYQLSCGTVRGGLCMTGQFAEPVVDRPMAKEFMRSVVACLRVVGADVQRPSPVIE